MKILSMPAGAGAIILNDTTISAPSGDITKTLYTATANKNVKITIDAALGNTQNWTASGFNSCYVTIGGNTYNFSAYTEPYTNPVSSVRVVINAPIANGESLSIRFKNNSGQYTKTFVTQIEVY